MGEPLGLWHITGEPRHNRQGMCGVYPQPASPLPTGLIQHHNIHWTIWFSPLNPSAKAKISTEEAKQILFCPTKPSSGWNAGDEIPTVFTDGDTATHPHIRPTQNVGCSQITKTALFFFPLLLRVMMPLGLHFGLNVPNQEQICSQESMLDRGRSHQSVVNALLGIHGHGREKEAANNHGRAREPWLGLSVLSQRKKKLSGEKPLSSVEGIRIYCHIR